MSAINRRASAKSSTSNSNNFASASGYGALSSSGSGEDCCPLVVDPLLLLTLTSFIAAAVYLLNIEITMSMLMMARRKREAPQSPAYCILQGRLS